MTAAVRTFVVRPAWHLARIAQWTARLVRGRPGAHQRLLEDARLRSRQVALQLDRTGASCHPPFVDTVGEWRRT